MTAWRLHGRRNTNRHTYLWIPMVRKYTSQFNLQTYQVTAKTKVICSIFSTPQQRGNTVYLERLSTRRGTQTATPCRLEGKLLILSKRNTQETTSLGRTLRWLGTLPTNDCALLWRLFSLVHYSNCFGIQRLNGHERIFVCNDRL